MKDSIHLPDDMATGATAASRLESLLHAKMPVLSRADRRLASYLLTNIGKLQFETGASMARAVGVSEMTVSRFMRTIGFQNLRQLKQALRADSDRQPLKLDEAIARLGPADIHDTARQEDLRLDMEAVAKCYALAGSPAWDDAMTRLADAETVYVLGFDISRGLAIHLASRLQKVRPKVNFLFSDMAGFGEVLTADPASSVVLMIDTASYAKGAIKMAERLNLREIPIVILTDKAGTWGWTYSRWVFEAQSHNRSFWNSTVGLCVLVNLLLDDVAAKLGPRAVAHSQSMAEVGRSMGEGAGRQGVHRSDA